MNARSITSLGDIVSEILRHKNAHEGIEYGKALREGCPRSSLGAWQSVPGRTQAADLVLGQEADRLGWLVPIRHERMASSAFAFYRGNAIGMAADLSKMPVTGINVQAVGDAHVSNFGAFMSPDRRLVWDVNDFDESAPGPWEWDVMRLVASLVIGARQRGFSKKEADDLARSCAEAYRLDMRAFAEMGDLDVWYSRFEVEAALRVIKGQIKGEAGREVKRSVHRALGKNSMRAVRKLTTIVDGQLRVNPDPPLIIPLSTMTDHVSPEQLMEALEGVLGTYLESLSPDRRQLLNQYSVRDVAMKAVGVGSLGTRAWIVVLSGRDDDDPLVLQVKEAGPSVLEEYCGRSPYENHGRRVVEGQHLVQSASDVFLGWARGKDVAGDERDFYVRQLWDGKASPDLDLVPFAAFKRVGLMSAWSLAHGHARSGDRFAIAGYLGGRESFDKAMVRFANSYADQNQYDYEAFLDAIRRLDGEERPDVGDDMADEPARADETTEPARGDSTSDPVRWDLSPSPVERKPSADPDAPSDEPFDLVDPFGKTDPA